MDGECIWWCVMRTNDSPRMRCVWHSSQNAHSAYNIFLCRARTVIINVCHHISSHTRARNANKHHKRNIFATSFALPPSRWVDASFKYFSCTHTHTCRTPIARVFRSALLLLAQNVCLCAIPRLLIIMGRFERFQCMMHAGLCTSRITRRRAEHTASSWTAITRPFITHINGRDGPPSTRRSSRYIAAEHVLQNCCCSGCCSACVNIHI